MPSTPLRGTTARSNNKQTERGRAGTPAQKVPRYAQGKTTTGASRSPRYRPGTSVLLEIHRLQHSTDLIIKKLPFERLLSDMASEFMSNLPL